MFLFPDPLGLFNSPRADISFPPGTSFSFSALPAPEPDKFSAAEIARVDLEKDLLDEDFVLCEIKNSALLQIDPFSETLFKVMQKCSFEDAIKLVDTGQFPPGDAKALSFIDIQTRPDDFKMSLADHYQRVNRIEASLESKTPYSPPIISSSDSLIFDGGHRVVAFSRVFRGEEVLLVWDLETNG